MRSKTKTDSYEIEYFTSSKHQIKTVHVKFTVFNYSYKQNAVACRPGTDRKKALNDYLIETSNEDYADDFDQDSKFELKIEYPATSDKPIEVFYAAPVSLYMKVYCKGPDIVAATEMGIVEADRWLPLPVEHEENTLVNQFNFEFIIHYGYYGLKSISVPKSQLNKDLSSLLNDSKFSDLEVTSVELKVFNVHKAILAARSEYFKELFENNKVEPINRVSSPFTTDVLQQVLTYIYTDRAPKIKDTSVELLKASNCYKLHRLKKLCEEVLHVNLTVENAIETLELAHKFEATDLKKITLEFIDMEKAKMLVETPSWKNLESVELIKSIFESVVNERAFDVCE